MFGIMRAIAKRFAILLRPIILIFAENTEHPASQIAQLVLILFMVLNILMAPAHKTARLVRALFPTRTDAGTSAAFMRLLIPQPIVV
jgi:hypothetical protein